MSDNPLFWDDDEEDNLFFAFIQDEMDENYTIEDEMTAREALSDDFEAAWALFLSAYSEKFYYNLMNIQQRVLHAFLLKRILKYFNEDEREAFLFESEEEKLGFAISMAWLILMELDDTIKRNEL